MTASELCIRRQGKHTCDRTYWTGEAWSRFVSRAAIFDKESAARILAHRFHRMDPLPVAVPLNEEHKSQ